MHDSFQWRTVFNQQSRAVPLSSQPCYQRPNIKPPLLETGTTVDELEQDFGVVKQNSSRYLSSPEGRRQDTDSRYDEQQPASLGQEVCLDATTFGMEASRAPASVSFAT